MARRLVLLAKPPLPGRSKTRLAAEIGVAAAARVAEALLHATITLCESIAERSPDGDLKLVLAYTDSEDWFVPALSRAWRLIEQRGADLGERMESVLADLGQADGDRAVLIGMDCPHMPSQRVAEAFEALGGADAVLGPCEDGGYYLLGVRGALPDRVLEGVPWGTAAAFDRTASALEAAKLSVTCLPSGYDVDTARDLHRLVSETAADSSSRLADLARKLSGSAGPLPG